MTEHDFTYAFAANRHLCQRIALFRSLWTVARDVVIDEMVSWLVDRGDLTASEAANVTREGEDNKRRVALALCTAYDVRAAVLRLRVEELGRKRRMSKRDVREVQQIDQELAAIRDRRLRKGA
jgi:hypothetical protein